MTCGFHTNYKKKKRRIRRREVTEGKQTQFFFIFLYYFLLSLISSIYGNRTVRIRRGNKQSALLNEGYAWEPKTRDFVEFF